MAQCSHPGPGGACVARQGHRDQRAAHPARAADEANKPVTILGDKTIPYSALKRVMASVQAADFKEVQLAIDRPGAKAT